MSANHPLRWGCDYDPLWYDCIRGPQCPDCPELLCEGGCGEIRENCGCPADDYDEAAL